MRALGIDLGSKRIGVAVSDRSGTIASPFTVLQRTGSPARDHRAIAALAAEEEAEILVVGLPLNMNGSEGPAAQAARKEAAALATVVPVPVTLFDERRTTVTADMAMMEARMNAQARRKVVDKVAAAVMLQQWLDAGRPGGTAVTYVDETQWRADPWDDPDQTDALMLERPPRQYRAFKWLTWLAIYAGMAGIVAWGLWGLSYTRKVNPPGDPGPPMNFTVNADDTLQSISLRLEEEGLVSDADTFIYYVDHHGGLELTPGYYQIRPSDHMGNVMSVLGTPPSETYTKVTFPEGFTYEQMALRLADRAPRLSAVDFDNAATDGSIDAAWLPDGITSLEGLLFPDTYQVSNGESEREVLQRMVHLMERVGAQEEIEDGAARLGLTPYQVLIVASMIEREARVDEDRPKIARVIYNRLFLGMPLGIDATLYYQQDPSLPFSLLKTIDSPYNTYLHAGLPPTPIANPGRASIRAALNPAANPSLGDPICAGVDEGFPCLYLYYVIADEDGRHVFSATLEQQEANIEEARRKGLL